MFTKSEPTPEPVKVEKLNTIKIISKLIPEYTMICIRPFGKRVYYFGKLKDVPDDLLESDVLELSPYVTTPEFRGEKVHGVIIFIINPVLKYDLEYDENHRKYSFLDLD